MSAKAKRNKALYAAALIVLLAGTGTWLTTGAHRGWTKTEITVMKHDEVTGIDYPEQHKGFVAGLDVLGLSAGLALGLAGLGFALRPKA